MLGRVQLQAHHTCHSLAVRRLHRIPGRHNIRHHPCCRPRARHPLRVPPITPGPNEFRPPHRASWHFDHGPRVAYHAWDFARWHEQQARGRAGSQPPPEPSRPPRQHQRAASSALANREPIVLCDWHGVLDRGWNQASRVFTPSGAQCSARVGANGKARFSQMLRPHPPNIYIDDKPIICRELRKTGAIVIQSNPNDPQGLQDDLLAAQQAIDARGRNNLPIARYLQDSELLFEFQGRR